MHITRSKSRKRGPDIPELGLTHLLDWESEVAIALEHQSCSVDHLALESHCKVRKHNFIIDRYHGKKDKKREMWEIGNNKELEK